METTTNTKKFFRHSSVEGKPSKVGAVPCSRCGGSGIFHIWGTCFRCGGNGQDPTERQWVFPTDWTDEQIEDWNAKREARNEANRRRSADRRQAEREATWERNLARCPELDWVAGHPNRDSISAFLVDVAFKAREFDLTDKQIAAFVKGIERQQQWDAEKAAAAEAKAQIPAWEVTGKRQTVEGTVATLKWQDNDFGGSLKMRLVTDAGQGLWISVPSSIDPEVDDRVRLDCAVQVSNDDPTFAFGSRPTKAEVI